MENARWPLWNETASIERRTGVVNPRPSRHSGGAFSLSLTRMMHVGDNHQWRVDPRLVETPPAAHGSIGFAPGLRDVQNLVCPLRYPLVP
jgi:hypothetical protein